MLLKQARAGSDQVTAHLEIGVFVGVVIAGGEGAGDAEGGGRGFEPAASTLGGAAAAVFVGVMNASTLFADFTPFFLPFVFLF